MQSACLRPRNQSFRRLRRLVLFWLGNVNRNGLIGVLLHERIRRLHLLQLSGIGLQSQSLLSHLKGRVRLRPVDDRQNLRESALPLLDVRSLSNDLEIALHNVVEELALAAAARLRSSN